MTVKEYLEIFRRFPNPNDNSKYHVHYDGEQEDYDKLVAYNKELINKYPWLMPINRWSGFVADDYDYTYTELDDMPEGWRVAFGDSMCQELQEELEKFNFVEDFSILQIKEKYGSLRFYVGCCPEGSKVNDIIDKYEALSERTCIMCGEPATCETAGWVSPYCDTCKGAILLHSPEIKFRDIDERQ